MSNIYILSDSNLISYDEQAPVNIANIKNILENEHQIKLMSISEFSDHKKLNIRNCDLLILPYGPIFPGKAVENFKRYFREGGKVMTIGGYAFKNIVRRDRSEKVYLGSNVPKTVHDWIAFDSSSIPVFDLEHKLLNVSDIKSDENQEIFETCTCIEGDFEGYSAITVLGNNRGRWQPLINAYDRIGELKGTVGAVMHLFIEPEEENQQPDIEEWKEYTGTSIAFFGVSNTDIFDMGNEDIKRGLVKLAGSLITGVHFGCIHNKYDCYRQGESPEISVDLENTGRQSNEYVLQLDILDSEEKIIYSSSTSCEVMPGCRKTTGFVWKAEKFDDDFYTARITCISSKGIKIDKISIGFSVWNEDVVKNGVRFTCENNYIYIKKSDGTKRAVFATGTDDGANLLLNLDQDPQTYRNDMKRFKDLGIYIYENLQQYPEEARFEKLLSDPKRKEEHFRKVDNIVYLAQKYGIIYKMGTAICVNVACSDEKLEKLADSIQYMAERYKKVPGLIFYLNGDLVCRLDDTVKKMFNDFLKKRYGSDEEIRKYWEDKKISLGHVKVEKYKSKRWSDSKAFDYNIFKTWLIKRWTGRLIKAIKSVDDDNHPIVCEFYQYPADSVDIPCSIGELTYSNIGFFGNFHNISETLGYTDQRYRGKSFGVGEFGKKTHPLFRDAEWTGHRSSNMTGAMNHFFQIFNTTLSMGGNHLLTWCNKDESKYIFPWGLRYGLDHVPRNIYFWMRNCNLFCRYFEPVYETARVGLILPDNTRMSGSQKSYDGHYSALRSIDILQRLNIGDMIMLNECDLRIDPNTDVLFYPIAYSPTEEVYEKIKKWVFEGGVLYFSGDISYDRFKQRSYPNRLEELAGVKLSSINYNGADHHESGCVKYRSLDGSDKRKGKPGINTSLSGAEILYLDDEENPIVTEYKFGKGFVVFSADTFECFSNDTSIQSDMKIYRHVLKAADIECDKVKYKKSKIKYFELSLKNNGRLLHFSNLGFEESSIEYGCYRLSIEREKSLLLLEDPSGDLTGGLFNGPVYRNGKTVLESSAYAFVISNNGKEIYISDSLMILPQTTGKLKMMTGSSWKQLTVVSGQVLNGKWHQISDLPVSMDDKVIELDIGDQELNTIIIVAEKNNIEEETRKMTDKLLNS